MKEADRQIGLIVNRREALVLLGATGVFFFFKQKTAYEIGLGIPAEPLFRSTFLKASHSFRNRLLVICKNAYLFATMIMTSVSSPFSCCSGIVRLNLM